MDSILHDLEQKKLEAKTLHKDLYELNCVQTLRDTKETHKLKSNLVSKIDECSEAKRMLAQQTKEDKKLKNALKLAETETENLKKSS